MSILLPSDSSPVSSPQPMVSLKQEAKKHMHSIQRDTRMKMMPTRCTLSTKSPTTGTLMSSIYLSKKAKSSFYAAPCSKQQSQDLGAYTTCLEQWKGWRRSRLQHSRTTAKLCSPVLEGELLLPGFSAHIRQPAHFRTGAAGVSSPANSLGSYLERFPAASTAPFCLQ